MQAVLKTFFLVTITSSALIQGSAQNTPTSFASEIEEITKALKEKFPNPDDVCFTDASAKEKLTELLKKEIAKRINGDAPMEHIALAFTQLKESFQPAFMLYFKGDSDRKKSAYDFFLSTLNDVRREYNLPILKDDCVIL